MYFAIWKSIKSSAKARYFTATIPLILIIIFLAKSLTLEGADKGMRYFFKPRLELLADAKVSSVCFMQKIFMHIVQMLCMQRVQLVRSAP